MPRRIVILEGAPKLGAKILVSGGGRCNVTHHAVHPRDFNAASQHVVRNVLAAFDAAATVRWFASLGVELKREPTGKLFPVANSAKVVLNALLRRCAELGVVIHPSNRVTEIIAPHAAGEPFKLETATGGSIRVFRVIVCTGGR